MKLFGNSSKNKNDSPETFNIGDDRKYLLWTNNDFFLRESFKTLRTNVIFALANTEGCKVVAITSGMQGEGKSTVAANLAMSFVDMGAKVLIVECDLRRPKLAMLLECQTGSGITNAFIDISLLKSSIVKYEGGELDVLPCGSIPPNPSELLGSEKMRKILDILKQDYDYIILDTPPVNMVTDAMVLAAQTDGLIYVVKANQSDRRDFLHAMEQMEYARTKVLGVVFNGTEQGFGGYGYKRYGYSGGYSGYSSK